MCSKISWCFGKSFFVDNLRPKIIEIEDERKRDYLNIRYLRVVKRLEAVTKRTSMLYYLFSLNVTVGSLLIPPLLSVEEDTFWGIFSISLLVSGSNAIIKLFHLDKTYVTRNIRLNQFKSEGMLYLSKSGIYNIVNDDERFRLFVKNIEKFKREQIMEEYTQNREEEREQITLV
jgi:hypothetical protein